MKQVFGPESRVIVRCFWSLVLLCLCGIFVAQVTNRISYYLSDPVRVTMKIKRSSEMKFPAVTLCYKSFVNPERSLAYVEATARQTGQERSEVTLADLLATHNETTLLREIGFLLDDYLVECYFGRNRTCDSQGRFLPLVTVVGLCYQYVLDKAVGTSGLFNNFYARLKAPPTREGDEEGWRLLLHNTEGSVALRVVTEGKSVYPKWNPDIQVTMKEFNTLNTWTSPCESQAGYSDRDCELGCFERAFSAGGGCWLPFMTPGSAAPCASAEQYSFSLEFVDTLLYGGNWTRGGCKCPSACDDVTYETYSDSREVEADTTRIRIFYNDLTYQEVTEEWAYTLIPLMCDIGGVLGLLLGASVLTFIELLQCVLACCSRGCPNARQGTVTALSLH